MMMHRLGKRAMLWVGSLVLGGIAASAPQPLLAGGSVTLFGPVLVDGAPYSSALVTGRVRGDCPNLGYLTSTTSNPAGDYQLTIPLVACLPNSPAFVTLTGDGALYDDVTPWHVDIQLTLTLDSNGNAQQFQAIQVSTTSVLPETGRLPISLSAAPNPTRGALTLSYDLPSESVVRLEVFDVAGRSVRRFAAKSEVAGRHVEVWDGRDQLGRELPSGVFFARLHAGDSEVVKRVVLLAQGGGSR